MCRYSNMSTGTPGATSSVVGHIPFSFLNKFFARLAVYVPVPIHAFKSVANSWTCTTITRSEAAVVEIATPTTSKNDVELQNLPSELKTRILECLEYEQIFQMQCVSKGWKLLIRSNNFLETLSPTKASRLTACYSFIENGEWHWAGFDPNWNENDTHSGQSLIGKWRRLPPLTFLPSNCSPDVDLFKQFLCCSSNGLVCMNFSKTPHREKLIVFNPLTQQLRELPPLLHRRNPVMIHMEVDTDSESYQVVIAGSGELGDESTSKYTEWYDSRTGKWARVGDLPGPEYSLNEYQSGIFLDGIIFCIGFFESHGEVRKGILGFNVGKREWSAMCSGEGLPSSTILQLVENGGELYLFSERENGRVTEHCVDRIEWIREEGDESGKSMYKLMNIGRRIKRGGKSLEVYPESALVPFSENELCLVNTVDRTGEVFDVWDPEKTEALPALPAKGFRGERGFYCSNAMSFAFEPRFCSKV